MLVGTGRVAQLLQHVCDVRVPLSPRVLIAVRRATTGTGTGTGDGDGATSTSGAVDSRPLPQPAQYAELVVARLAYGGVPAALGSVE